MAAVMAPMMAQWAINQSEEEHCIVAGVEAVRGWSNELCKVWHHAEREPNVIRHCN